MRKTCPACGSDGKGDPIGPQFFVHRYESDPTWDRSLYDSHEQQVKRWHQLLERARPASEERCFCLPWGDMPEDERFFSRFIGIEVTGVYDGTLVWLCPDCGHMWPRFALADWPNKHQAGLDYIAGQDVS